MILIDILDNKKKDKERIKGIIKLKKSVKFQKAQKPNIKNKKVNNNKIQKYQERMQKRQKIQNEYDIMLKELDINVNKISELASGVKLSKIVNKIFYDDNNKVLSNSIITQNQQRKGNNVINMNIILKQIKLNNKITCPEYISNFTTFKLLDNQQDMIKFVKWLYQCYKKCGISNEDKKYKEHNVKNKQNICQQKKNKNNYNKSDKIIQIIDHYQQNNNQYQTTINQPNIFTQNNINDNQNNSQGSLKNQNIFQNVFFCDQLSPQKINIEINDSFNQSQKISKKGSFKIIRPKSNFQDQPHLETHQNQNQCNGNINSPLNDKTSSKIQDIQNRLVNRNEQNRSKYESDDKQSSARKTIPKMSQRPPIYKKQNKSQTKTQTQQKTSNTNNQNTNNKIQYNFNQPSPFTMQSSNIQNQDNIIKNIKNNLTEKKQIFINPSINHVNKYHHLNYQSKNNNLFHDIKNIQQQIQHQQSYSTDQNKKYKNSQSNSFLLNNQNPIQQQQKQQKKQSKYNRKILKIQIKQLTQIQKKSIIAWLISINLLNSIANNYFQRFHQICKNGVIFPEIVNYQIGKSGELCYFKNPVKSAQVHSNYQKVFTYLSGLPNFQNQLLFMYQYFVPQALQSAFWSLLKSCKLAFQKQLKSNKQKNQSQQKHTKDRIKSQNITKSLKKQHNSTNMMTNNLQQYNKIKYGSCNKIKQSKNIKQFPYSHNQSITKSQKQQKNKRKTSLDFIKQLPDQPIKYKQQQLIQVQQPLQQKQQKGYKQLHQLKKSHNMSIYLNTPQKKKTQIQLYGSRIVTTNSIKKIINKIQIPSISLQMEIKTIKYLKQKGYINLNVIESLPLFQDQLRNGTLFNKIIIDQLKVSYKYHTKPRNIADCRQNFKKGFNQLKQSSVILPPSFQLYYQNIIKGQLNIFYGIIFYILTVPTNKHILNLQQYPINNQSTILSAGKNYSYQQNLQQTVLPEILFWIRQLQQQSTQISAMQIRDFPTLLANILLNNFLYKIANVIIPQKYAIKPTYDQPLTPIQQQSNIKKILSFYSHNKIIKSDLVYKAKYVVKKQKYIILKIVKQLMNYSKSIKKSLINIKIEPDNPVISFVKFTRQNSKDQIKQGERQRNSQGLETTLTNNSFSAPLQNVPTRKQSQKSKEPPATTIEIPWMRQLGFTEDLSLNNGVILCRLISKLTMQSLNFNQNPTSKAQCLTNIRKALKLVDKFKWNEQDMVLADEKTTIQIYKYIKDKYKHSYALKNISQIK